MIDVRGAGLGGQHRLDDHRGEDRGDMHERGEKRRFSDVLEAVDAAPRSDRCAFGWGACDPRQPCPLHTSWGPMNEAFRTWAETSTFAGFDRRPQARAPRRATRAFARRQRLT